MRDRGSQHERLLHTDGPAGGFRKLVATLGAGGVPDLGTNAQINRTGITSTVVTEGTAAGYNQRALQTGPDPNPVGEILVNNPDFSTGGHLIQLGDFQIVADVDYFPVQANANNSATNLAAAINNLPGVTAAAVGATVTVRWSRPGLVRFNVRHFGTITNLVLSGTGAVALERSNLLDYGDKASDDPPLITA